MGVPRFKAPHLTIYLSGFDDFGVVGKLTFSASKRRQIRSNPIGISRDMARFTMAPLFVYFTIRTLFAIPEICLVESRGGSGSGPGTRHECRPHRHTLRTQPRKRGAKYCTLLHSFRTRQTRALRGVRGAPPPPLAFQPISRITALSTTSSEARHDALRP